MSNSSHCNELITILKDNLPSWFMLEYPFPKEKRIQLIVLYYHICTTPGMPTFIVQSCSSTIVNLLDTKKLTIKDLRLPWRPVYDLIHNKLFMKSRQVTMRLVYGLAFLVLL